MDADRWRDLCYRSLQLPDGPGDRRVAAAERLLERAGLPVTLAGIGAAERALELVARAGRDGNLDEVFLGLENDAFLGEAEGERRVAMACARTLLEAVVAWVEQDPAEQA